MSLYRALQKFVLVFSLFQIYKEADLDNDQSLSFAEFEHVITKAPDFIK